MKEYTLTKTVKQEFSANLLFWANYEYEGRPLCFVKIKDALPSYVIVQILMMFDLWYGDTDQDTTDWALEFQLLTRMLVRENALLANPKYLEIPEDCLEALCATLRGVNPESEITYRALHHVRQADIDKLYDSQEN